MKNNVVKYIIPVIAVALLLSSCGPKIGDKLTARDNELNKFYQTWDGKIHQVNSVRPSSMYRWIMFDDDKVNYDDIKSYQDNKGYYVNRWGIIPENAEKTDAVKKIRGYQSMSPMFFAERLIKGKLNVYFAITYRDPQTGSRGDYFFQKGSENAITPLRTFTLKSVVADCKDCKTLFDDAVAIYDDLPKWRKNASDGYIASEKKLVSSLIGIINEYNKH